LMLPDIDAERIRLVDLGVASPLFYDGNWTDADSDWKLLARVAWDTGMGSTRYGEYRLSRTGTEDEAEKETFALHIDICLPAGTRVVAPFIGTVKHASSMFSLRGKGVALFIEGLGGEPAEGTEIAAGEAIGVVAGEENAVGGLRIRLSRDLDTPPPLFCRPSEAPVWRHLAPSPSSLLGMDCDAPPARAKRIARAWREFFFDETGKSLIDVSGTAPMIGHGHPEVAVAAYRQHLLISTAHDGQADIEALKQALAKIAPQGLNHVVLFADAQSAVAAMTTLAKTTPAEQDAIAEGDDDEPQADETSDEGAVEQETTPGDISTVFIEPIPGETELAIRIAAAREGGNLVALDERRTGYGQLVDVMWAAEGDGMSVNFVMTGSCGGGELVAVFCTAEFQAPLNELARPVSPVAISTTLATLKVFLNEGLRENAAASAGILSDGLRDIAERARDIVDLKGAGLLWTMQLSGESPDLRDRLNEGAVHGDAGPAMLLIAPPLCISEKSAARYLAHLRHALGILYE
jgi:4-aminobutyrate aminotransferase-like enzyme